MTTTVKHKGSVREWEGQIDNWMMNESFIKDWCDGRNYDQSDIRNLLVCSPLSYAEKPQPLEPKAGEVWADEEEGPCLITDENTVVWLDGTLAIGDAWSNDRVSSELKYSAPSFRAYFMREVMEQWEHEHKSLDSFTDWLKEQCEME